VAGSFVVMEYWSVVIVVGLSLFKRREKLLGFGTLWPWDFLQ